MSTPDSPPGTHALGATPAVRPRPILALLLSLAATGSGYYYAGARWRLVGLAVLVPVLLLCIALSVGLGLPPWIFLAYALLNVLVWIDTFRQARRPDARRPPRPEVAGTFVLCVVYFTALSWMFRAYVLEPFYVSAASMAPTLLIGDYFTIDKIAYLRGEPQRGDMAVFRYPDDRSTRYVKRVIGIPGDVVEITAQGEVVLNGAPLALQRGGAYSDRVGELTLLREETGPDRSHLILRLQGSRYGAGLEQRFEVPADSYFVLGDSRDNSKDSRRWNNTYVPRDDMLGRAVYLHWSRDPETGSLRFERIGKLPERVDLPAETAAPTGP
jgi:signal peptidase I